MTNKEYEQFVLECGNDILNFCKIHTMDDNYGWELYQEAMYTILRKKEKIDITNNVKSYAISVAIKLWKNRKKTYAKRKKKVNFISFEAVVEDNGQIVEDISAVTPENQLIEQETINYVRKLVFELPVKLRLPIILFYSSDMKINDIAEILKENPNTIKTRLRKAKAILKEKLEVAGYE